MFGQTENESKQKIFLLKIDGHNFTQFIVKFRHRPIDHRPVRIGLGINLDQGFTVILW